MIDLTKLKKLDHMETCAVLFYKPEYLDELFAAAGVPYEFYSIEFFMGGAPISEEEVFSQLRKYVGKEYLDEIPAAISAPFDSDELCQALLPLYVEPIDEDYLKWQERFDNIEWAVPVDEDI